MLDENTWGMLNCAYAVDENTGNTINSTRLIEDTAAIIYFNITKRY